MAIEEWGTEREVGTGGGAGDGIIVIPRSTPAAVGLREPLLLLKPSGKNKESVAVVLLSVGVAVWGAFVFGTCVGFSAPSQSGMMKDLGLSLSEAMRIASTICLLGWMAIYYSKGIVMVCIGRILTGCSVGIFSYVVPTYVAEISPQDLRGGLTSLNQGYNHDMESLSNTTLQDVFFGKRYIRSITVAVGLMIFQQFIGVGGIGFFASQLFVDAGFQSGDIGTAIMGSIQVYKIPVTLLGALLTDRIGRKPLLIVSAIGTLTGLLVTAVSFSFKEQGLQFHWIPVVALVGVLFLSGSFSIGMAAIPWVIMSEVFPLNIKRIGGSFVTFVNWFGSWVTSYTFNFLMAWSSSGTFFIYSTICATSIIFIVKVVPETKGKTLEDIQASLN